MRFPPKRPMLGLALLFACWPLPALAAQEPLTPLTVMDLMVGAIEPASNAIWAIGLEENAPKSEADWKAVEYEAIQLLAATSALSLGGSGRGERDLAAQEKWQEFTLDMAEVTLDILKAIRERDYDATLEAGNFLIEPCGACHSTFPISSRRP